MKNLFLLAACILAFALQSYAQEVPNGDMEDWVPDNFFNLTSEKPNQWFTFNIPFLHFVDVPYGVSKTTDSHSGNFALRLENTHNLIGHVAGIGNIIQTGVDSMELIRGIPFTCDSIPTKISGYYKCNLTNPGDTTFIRVHLYQGNDPATNLVALTRIDLVHPLVQNEYTFFEQQLDMLSNNPIESIYIEIDMSRLPDEDPIVIGDFLQLDDLDLDVDCNISANISVPNPDKDIVKIYPNPARDYIKIEIEPFLAGNAQLLLFDVNGKKLKSETLASIITNISLTNLPKELFYQIVDNNQKVIKSGQLLNLK